MLPYATVQRVEIIDPAATVRPAPPSSVQPSPPAVSPQQPPRNVANGVRTDRNLIRQLNEHAVETSRIGANTFRLEAYLWHDYMPMSGPRTSRGGRAMLATNTLISTNHVGIPNNIRMVKQFVIYRDQVWVSNYTNEEIPHYDESQAAYHMERISRGGPNWGIGIRVDVISQILDTATNQVYYIRIRNVHVERVD